MTLRQLHTGLIVLLVLAMALTTAGYAQDPGDAQPASWMGTAFTYQGQIRKDGALVNGLCDFEFNLWDAVTGGSTAGSGTVLRTAVPMTEGRFTIPNLDFGSSAFVGDARWLSIQARCPAGSGSYVLLSPRQPLTPTPYALGLRPGAMIVFDFGGQAALTAVNQGSGERTAGLVGVAGEPAPAATLWPAGVRGESRAGAGVYGASETNHGVRGFSQDQSGVYGESFGAPGVRGDNLTDKPGVLGYSQHGPGVSGVANDAPGVRGEASSGPGGYFTANYSFALVANGPVLLGGRNPQQIAMLRWYEVNSSGHTIAVGSIPDQLAFDGDCMWVTNWNAGTVTRVRASDEAILGTYPAGSNPNPIVFDGQYLWVGSESSPQVTKIRASDGATVATITGLPSGHWGMAYDGSHVWVTNTGADSVTRIRVRDNAIVGTYPVGDGPHGIAYDGRNQAIWVANNGSGTVTRLLASTGADRGTFPVQSAPYGIAFDGESMWVTNSASSSVTRINVMDPDKRTNFAVPASPIWLAFDGFNLWITHYLSSGQVTKLRVLDGTVVTTFPVGQYPIGVAFDGANMWVANTYSNNVSKH